MDYLLAQANAKGIKVILTLTNNWKEFGGMDQYVTWYGLQYHDQFYTDARVKQAYKNWAAHLINRVNTVTGVAYKDDPAIFSWELANEPRCINANKPTSGTCTTATITSWAKEMSDYIKSLDANHMVSVGDEGFLAWGRGSDWPYNGTDGVDHEALMGLPSVDFGTYHLYPDHWSKTPEWGTQWIKDHLAAAKTVGKPSILEEFGLQNKSTRDGVYQTWTQTVREGGGAGWNFWILSGTLETGQLYPDYDGFTVYHPSTTATVLANEAAAISSGTTTPPPDTTAPSAPTGLTSTGKTATSVSLSWTASTDNVGVTGYDVYRGTTKVGSPSTTSFTDTGLTPSTAYSYTVRARDAAGNTSVASSALSVTTSAESSPSPSPSPSTSPSPSPSPSPSGGVKVQYKNNDSSATDNQIKPGLNVVNTGTSSLDLSGVTVRYYFTRDGGSSTFGAWCDWTQLGCSNVRTKVVLLTTPVSGADAYLELSFTGGTLAPGAGTGELQLRFSKSDWSAFNETNDYSRGTNTTFADAGKVTAYRGTTLAWGTPPA